MKILWVLSLYDEEKQLFDKAIVQMGEDDDIHDIQSDVAEIMVDMLSEYEDYEEGENESDESNLNDELL